MTHHQKRRISLTIQTKLMLYFIILSRSSLSFRFIVKNNTRFIGSSYLYVKPLKKLCESREVKFSKILVKNSYRFSIHDRVKDIISNICFPFKQTLLGLISSHMVLVYGFEKEYRVHTCDPYLIAYRRGIRN